MFREENSGAEIFVIGLCCSFVIVAIQNVPSFLDGEIAMPKFSPNLIYNYR